MVLCVIVAQACHENYPIEALCCGAQRVCYNISLVTGAVAPGLSTSTKTTSFDRTGAHIAHTSPWCVPLFRLSVYIHAVPLGGALRLGSLTR